MGVLLGIEVQLRRLILSIMCIIAALRLEYMQYV